MKYVVTFNDDHIEIGYAMPGYDYLEEMKKWKPEVLQNVKSVERVDDASIPTDRTFRDQWKSRKNKVTVDTEAVIQRVLKRVRRVRKIRFNKLDQAFIIASGLKDEAALELIASTKATLRDLPIVIEAECRAVNSVEEMKLIMDGLRDRFLKPEQKIPYIDV
jgi:hypothetical protein